MIKLYACQPFLAKVEPGPLQSLAAVECVFAKWSTSDCVV